MNIFRHRPQSTSERIAVQVTFFFMVFISIFCVILQGVYFSYRYISETLLFDRAIDEFKQGNRVVITNKTILVFDRLGPMFDIISNNLVWGGLFVRFEDNRYIYGQDGNYIYLKGANTLINRQRELALSSLILIAIFGLTSYLFAKKIASNMTKDIRHIAEHTKQININSLDKKIQLPHIPDHDELQPIITGINVMQQQLKDQLSVLTEFIAHARHEFNTPLMRLQSINELALHTKKYEHTITRNLDIIGRLNRLMEGLLVLTSSHLSPIDKQTIKLDELVQEIIHEQKEVWSKNLHISLTGKSIVTSNRGILEIILRNIISNSRKYTEEKGTITITIKKNYILIQDDGKGIDQENLTKIRQTFRKVDTVRGIDSGFGLGLSITKKLVDSIGRYITLTSEISKGTSVRLARKKI